MMQKLAKMLTKKIVAGKKLIILMFGKGSKMSKRWMLMKEKVLSQSISLLFKRNKTLSRILITLNLKTLMTKCKGTLNS